MFKEISIGKGRKLALKSNGLTPLYYKQTFGRDLLQMLTEDDEALTIASDKIPELAYIMAKQAEGADMTKLNQEEFLKWLETFEPLDMTMNSTAIANVYISDSLPSVDAKKKGKGKAKE